MLGLAGWFTALWLGYEWLTATYIACALSASSTLVVVRQLQQRRQMFEPYGRLVLGVLLLQDVFIITCMVVLLKAPSGWLAIVSGLGATALLGLLAFVIHRWFVPRFCARVKLDDEELLLASLALLFAFSALAFLLDLNFLVGAFFAGFALSAFPINGLVRGMFGSISGFFLALFFICMGAVLTLPSLGMLWHGFVFIVVLLVVTIVLVTVITEWVGYSTRVAIETSLLLSQTSEFSLLIALTGFAYGQITGDLFSVIVLVTIATMTLTPFIARENVVWSLMRFHPRYRRGEYLLADLKDHVVLLGYGSGGARTVKWLRDEGIRVVVIDDDAAVIRKLIEQEIPCIQGDGSDELTLRQANCRKAKAVIASMRRTRDALQALQFLKGCGALVMVRCFETQDAEAVRAAGGYPVLTSDASADKFIEWFAVNG